VEFVGQSTENDEQEVLVFSRNAGVKERVARTGGSVKDAVVGYVDPLADEKLRRRLAAAIAAGAAAQRRARRQAGLMGVARRLAADAVLRGQLIEMSRQLQKAQKRAKRARSHKLRNTVLLVAGASVVVAAVPTIRRRAMDVVRGRSDGWAPGGWSDSVPQRTTIEEEIEVGVPVTTAYNQWTQFEEFPRFMDGVDEVRQLDDTLLHWAATIAGKHAEWDAKIIEQEPDRRITWESIDGKQTRGTVSFQPAGADRTVVRLQMSYLPEGVSEKVGSAIGLDNRRVKGDLERFRDLLENRQVETGAWRGRIKGGVETDSN
jgi:uncharacterized membrane protein